jgi:tetratricopeptide (TPR) repeat protein
MTTAPEPGKILTFYSYKGGTGRSMALANVAWILASNGYRVLAMDWDLEAPGLHRYFAPFLIDPELSATDGLIDLVVDFEIQTVRERSTRLSADWFRARGAQVLDYTTALEFEEFRDGGELHFLPAGRQGPGYAARVNSFDWRGLYQNRGGRLFFDGAREALRERYDYVLIDSRTGVSDTSGICTLQMPDVLVACFTLNNQGIEGCSGIVGDVYRRRTAGPGEGPDELLGQNGDPAEELPDAGDALPLETATAWQAETGPGRPIAIFPVPMRVEIAEKERTESRLRHAQKRFAGFPNTLSRASLESYWTEATVPHIPYYAFEEILSTFRDRPGEPGSVLDASERLASYLTDGKVRRVIPPSDDERKRVLGLYAPNAMGPSSAAPTADQLAEQAELTFSRLHEAEQDAVRRLFTRFVRLARPEDGGDSWLRLPTSSLGQVESEVVGKFMQAGVLRTVSDPIAGLETVEVTSPALRRAWSRLARWLDGDREFLLWRRRLGVNVADWEGSDGDAGALLTGARLRGAERWLRERAADLSDPERHFIEESLRVSDQQKAQQALRARRAKRQWMSGIALSALVVTLLVASVFLQWGRSRELATERAALRSEQEQAAKSQAMFWAARGEITLRSNDLNGALRDYSQAIVSDSTYAAAYYERANIHLFRGDADAAIRDYSAALRLDPGYAQAYDSRATAYLRQGDTTRARADLQEFVKRAQDTERRDSAESWLARITQPAEVADTATTEAPVLTNAPPKPAISLVYIHYREPQVRGLVQNLRRGLEAPDREMMPPAPRTQTITRFTVRYFYLDDQERAEALRRDVQRVLASEGVTATVELLPLTEGYQRASRGHLEIWLPSTRPPQPPVDTAAVTDSVPPR